MVYTRVRLINRSVRILLAAAGIAALMLVIPGFLPSSGAASSGSKAVRKVETTKRGAAGSTDNVPGNAGTPEWLWSLGLPPVGPTVTATKSHTGGPFHLGDTITYSVTISDSVADATGVEFTDTPDANTTLVGGSVMVSPVAVNDGPYACTGNLSISVPVASGVLANDYLGLNPTATITAFDSTSANGGTVSLTTSGANAGAFTYQPAAGFTGTDTFTYTLSNSVGSSVGTVSISVTNMVWFINNAAGSAGDGRFASPFNTLAGFQAINDGGTNHGKTGQAIFIYQGSGNYTGPLTLLSNQRVIGQGDALTPTTLGFTPAPLTNITLPGATSNPTLAGTLTLATGVTVLAANFNTGSSNAIVGSGGLSGVTVGDTPGTASNAITVTTTTGTAVSLNNVGGTFTFHSITANGTGGTNTTGVSLVSMTGSFTVTGDGTTANSGGTIQHETGSNQTTVGTGSQGIGFFMNNAQNVSLSYMHLHDFDNFGLQGITVSSLTLAHCTFDGSNGNTNVITPITTGDPNQGEGSVYLYNLTGSCSFTNCTFSGGFSDTVEIVERTGTLSGLTIDTCSFSETNTTNGGDELDIFGPGSTNANIAVTLTNSTFTQAHGSTFSYISNGSGTMAATVTGNTFKNNDTTHAGHGVFLTYAGSDSTGTAFTFDVENNTFGGTATNSFKFTALAVGKAVPSSPASTTATGKIINNTFGTSGVQGSATSIGSNSDALEIDCDGQGPMTVLIKGNAIHGFDEYGMSLFDEEGSAPLNATVIGNTIDTPNTNDAFAGIDITVGANPSPADTNTACLHIGNVLSGETSADKNNISGNPGSVQTEQGNDILFSGQASASAQINLPGYTGAATDTTAVTNYLKAANTLADSPGVFFNQAVNNFHNTGGGADCAQPPLLFAPGGVEPDAAASIHGRSGASSAKHLSLPSSAILDQASLNLMVRAAIQRWKEAGLTDEQLAVLRGIRFGVADLTDSYLGASNSDLIMFDRKAAGHGWFIDRTPLDDKEFVRRVSSTLLYSNPKGTPAGRLDLLTAISHEMGHRLGLYDTYETNRRDDLMFESLSVGERRLPSKNEAETANFSGDGQADKGTEKQYILRAERGENTNEETRRYAQKLNQEVLNYLAQAGIQRWQDAGLTPAELDRLRSISLQIVDLPGDELSVTTPTSIQIDEAAAGYGWFADQTPWSESNFTLPIFDHEYQADLDSPAFGHMDLLTVLMNAYGRILHKTEKRAPSVLQAWLMKQWLPAGVRRVPSPGLTAPNDSSVLFQGDQQKSAKDRISRNDAKGRLTPQSAPVDVVIGALPVGKSVIVKFQVTVNNPLTSPSTATTVSNTGMVSGTNFSTVSSNTDTAQLCVPTTTTTALANQQVAQGTTATFTTTLTGSAPFTFVWKKNGSILTTGSLSGRVTITTNTVGSSTTSTLAIANTIPSDSDTYTADGTDLAACGDPAVHQSATLTVVVPPTVTKAFSPTTIPVGGTSQIQLTITNPNATVTLTGVNFSDNFTPGSGLQVANPAGIGSTCTGTWNATPGDTFLNFGGGTLPPGSSCTLTVNVTSTNAGTINNATNPPQSNEGGSGVASNTATLTVIGPPTISKAFVLNRTIAASPTGATESGTTATITTTTPHGFLVGESVAIAGVGVAGYNGTFTIASVPTSTTFTYTAGSSGLGASGGGTATATLTTMPLNGTATLQFKLTNQNTGTTLTGVSFTDALPSGLQVASTPNAVPGCGTFTPAAGATSLSFSGGTIASGATCTVSVDITATTAGVKNNTTGAVTSTEGGTGGTASASITVLSPPSISKAFGAANISPGGTTTLTFTITNPNASNQLLGVAFTDSLPSGLQVAATPGASTSCGGTFAPNAGDTTLTFSGGTISAGGMCTVAVNVTGTTGGAKTNTTGNVTSANAGTGNTGTAMITVASPPTVTKSFNPTTIPVGGTSQLTLTLTNPNAGVTLTGVDFSDNMPTGLQVASTPGIGSTCSGTWNATAGDTTLNFGGGTLTPGSSCSLTVNITATTAGAHNNTTNAPESNEGGTGVPSNTATLTAIAPPTLTKAFVLTRVIAASPTGATESGNTVTITTTTPHGFLVGQTVIIAGVGVAGYNGTFTIASVPTATTFTYTNGNAGLSTSGGGTATVDESTMPLNGTVTLMFTLTNPNSSTLTGIGFTDALPAGLQVAATPNASAPCGTFSPGAGDTTLTFSGGTLAASATCIVAVDVTATTAGAKNNTTSAVTSTEGGTGGTANASITVLSPPSIGKAFGIHTISPGGTTTLTFTITNPNTSNQLLGVGFTDALPSGLQVAATPGASTSCGGTFAPNAGDTSLTFSGGTVSASGTCMVVVNVTGTTGGVKDNVSGNVTSANAGTGNTANDTITVASPPTISKSFTASSIQVNGTTTLTFSITNPNSSFALTNVAFTDSLPSGLQVAATPNASTSCGGTFTPSAGDTTLNFSGGTLAASGTCTISVDVTGTTAGVKNNTTGTISSTESGPGATSNTATLTVVGPPTIDKAFVLIRQIAASPTGATESGSTVTITTTTPHNFMTGETVAVSGVGVSGYNGTFTIASVPTSTTFTYTDANTGLSASGGGTATATLTQMPLNSTATLVFTLMNTNATTTETQVAFTDALPAGLQVAATPNASAPCGTFNPNAGDTTLTFSGGTIAAGASCAVMVDVTATTAGVKNNVTGAISSLEGGTGGTASASITVVAPPTISKAFGAPNIPLNGTTTLTFTITNPNTTQQLTGVAFTDTLPSGLQVAATPGASTSCGGTFSPNAGDTTLNFSGGTIAASGTCTIAVNVTGTTGGVKNNTTGAVSSNEGGTGTTSNTATLSVASAPTLSKAFGASSILQGQTTSLQFTITNPNSSLGLTGVAFTDTLPAGLTVANGTSTTCGGGTVTTTAPGTITLTGGTLAASGMCSFSVTVTGAAAGVWNNTSGAISSNESGTGSTSNTATLTVIGAPAISKSFDAATIPLNGTSVLTFTITNPNTTTTLNGVAFTDTLPSGLTVPSGTSTTCGGGTLTTTAPGTIALTGGSIASSSNCVITVTVTGTTAGAKNNTTGAVSSTNGGTGTASNTATINVLAPPTISKSFGASHIPLSGTTSLSFTITNPNSTDALTGVGFTDTLPAGLTVPDGSTSQCGGTLAISSNVITLSGATVAANGTCNISLTVTGATGGVKNNTTAAVSSTNGGTGTTSNTATVTVATPPTLAKAFGALTIPLGGTTSLTFTITNTSATLGITGVGFTDTLPAGLTVPNGSFSTCGGGSVAVTGGNTITLSGGSIAAGGSCNFMVTVTGTAAGVMNNTSGAITSNETGTGSTSNTATVTVVAPGSISKAFSAPTVPLGGTATVTFTITNPNSTVALMGVGFTDSLPAGLKVASNPNTSTSCGGIVTATAGSSSITFSGGTVAASGTCTVTVDVTGVAAGVNNNMTSALSSSNGGTGLASNTATIIVLAPPTISKAFGSATVPIGQTTTLTFTLTNPNATVALTGVAFTDTFPSGLVVANPANASDSCGGTFAPNPGDTSLTFSGGTIAAGGTCTISVTVQTTTGGTKVNQTSPITSANGGTGLPSNQATVGTFDKCLKDNTTGLFVQFSSQTGDYMFTMCGPNGFTLSGKGTLQVVNSIINITDSKSDRRVTIQYSTASLTGTATLIKIPVPGVSQRYTINDTNPHAVCNCGS